MPEIVWRAPESVFGPPPHWTIAQGRRCWTPRESTLQTSLVLVDGGDVVAAAGAFVPELHSERLWGFVEVAPSDRRRGLGSQAVEELRRRLSPEGRLRTKAEPGSPGDHFGRRHGLHPLQHTRTVRVTVEPRELGDEVGVVGVVAASDDVVDAWRRYYVAGHSWDPPGQQPLSFWRQTLGSAEDVVLTWPSEPPFRGVAIVGPGGEWTGGAIERDDPEAVTVTTTLLGAAAHTTPTLEIELDDWMSEVRQALTSFRTEIVDQGVILAE